MPDETTNRDHEKQQLITDPINPSDGERRDPHTGPTGPAEDRPRAGSKPSKDRSHEVVPIGPRDEDNLDQDKEDAEIERNPP